MALIKIQETLEGDTLEQAWTLYQDSFEHLNSMTVQRHLMYRSEFNDVAADRRIEKWIATNGQTGNITGLATYTNILEAWPLISPAYFERRWPAQYALGRIWYCGFVAVHPKAASSTFFEMITGMYKVAEAADGVIGLDICRYNDLARRLGKVVGISLKRISGGRVRIHEADAQQFYVYEAINLDVQGAVLVMADAPHPDYEDDDVEVAGAGR